MNKRFWIFFGVTFIIVNDVDAEEDDDDDEEIEQVVPFGDEEKRKK